jgi:hypothetical protein
MAALNIWVSTGKELFVSFCAFYYLYSFRVSRMDWKDLQYNREYLGIPSICWYRPGGRCFPFISFFISNEISNEHIIRWSHVEDSITMHSNFETTSSPSILT